ncbi:unnamed protein product [Calypogeia fissa]
MKEGSTRPLVIDELPSSFSALAPSLIVAVFAIIALTPRANDGADGRTGHEGRRKEGRLARMMVKRGGRIVEHHGAKEGGGPVGVRWMAVREEAEEEARRMGRMSMATAKLSTKTEKSRSNDNVE